MFLFTESTQILGKSHFDRHVGGKRSLFRLKNGHFSPGYFSLCWALHAASHGCLCWVLSRCNNWIHLDDAVTPEGERRQAVCYQVRSPCPYFLLVLSSHINLYKWENTRQGIDDYSVFNYVNYRLVFLKRKIESSVYQEMDNVFSHL